jgi:hypothetical protein
MKGSITLGFLDNGQPVAPNRLINVDSTPAAGIVDEDEKPQSFGGGDA